jgi:hypothetical protein
MGEANQASPMPLQEPNFKKEKAYEVSHFFEYLATCFLIETHNSILKLKFLSSFFFFT